MNHEHGPMNANLRAETSGTFDFGSKAIAKLIRNRNHPVIIGIHPLARLRIVEDQLSADELRNTDENRGIVLGRVLEGIIEEELSLSPNDERWLMLHQIILHDKKQKNFMSNSSLSRSTIARRFKAACSLLGIKLMSSERKINNGARISKVKNETDYAQYLRKKHPDWSEEEIQERLKTTREVLADLSSFIT